MVARGPWIWPGTAALFLLGLLNAGWDAKAVLVAVYCVALTALLVGLRPPPRDPLAYTARTFAWVAACLFGGWLLASA